MPNRLQVSRRPARLLVVVALFFAASLALAAPPQRAGRAGAPQPDQPLTKQQILDSLRNVAAMSPNLSARGREYARQKLVTSIRQRGVDFRLSASDEEELLAAGAHASVVAAVRASYSAASRPREVEDAPTPRPTLVPTPRPTVVPTPAPSASPTPAAAEEVPSGPPLTAAQLVVLLRARTPPARVERMVKARGVGFALTRQVAREITAAGGTPSLLAAIRGKSAVADGPVETPATAGGTPAAPSATPANGAGNSAVTAEPVAPPAIALPPLPPPGGPPRPLAPGRSGRGYLALDGQSLTPETISRYGIGRGFLVNRVRPGGTAESAGLRGGDVITTVNGRPASDEELFWSAITSLRPGSTATLAVWRGGRSEKARADITDFPLYLELVAEASEQLRRGSADEAIRLLREAADLDPARHDAYPHLFTALLYYKSDPRSARAVMLRAHEVGGALVFRVRHDHSGGSFEQHCRGDLIVAGPSARFVADNGAHNFSATSADLRSAKLVVAATSGHVFAVELAPPGRAAAEHRFDTVSTITPTGGEKFSATGLGPTERYQMFAQETRLAVQLLNLILKR